MVTEANQVEMKETLQKLAAHHKKAKLQELFERQDELRPHPATIHKRPKHRRSHSVPNMDDVAAMRSQFQDMHQEAIQSRFQKQYMLRLSEVLKADDGADGDIEAETPGTFLDPDGTSAALKFNNFRPDGSDGEQKVDTQDVEEMKAEFGKYQKALLGTQIEKAFRLRADFDDAEDAAEQEQAHVTRMSQRDSEEMSATYRRLSKAQIDYSTLKQFETRVDAQIMPEHVCH